MPQRKKQDKYVHGMQHSLRRRIICHAVSKGKPISPVGTTKELEIGDQQKDLSNVSYHFKVLADFGLLRLHHTKPKRGTTEHFYVPRTDALLSPPVKVVLAENGILAP